MEDHVYRSMYEQEERHWWFRGRRAVIAALLRRSGISPPLRVLDAGCGTGRNLEDYARLGPVTGIDPSETAVRFCRSRGVESVLRAEVEDLPFEDQSFDLLCATDVLEHVDDDRLALSELRRVAAPAAHLLITVPAYMWLWSDSDLALHHCRRYDRSELASRVVEAGWRPVLASYFNTLLLPPIAIARRLRPQAGRARSELTMTRPWLDRPLSVPMRVEAVAIGYGANLPFGVSLGMVCRRSPASG